jgi:hypothetical protein
MFRTRRTQEKRASAFTVLEKQLLLAMAGIIALTAYFLVTKH